MNTEVTPIKPYFIRAFYDWIVDNGWTPLLLVDADYEGVDVPREYVKDGQIALNLTPRAIRDLQMENELTTFHTRFAGVSHFLRVPTGAILAIYADENKQALTFPPEPPPSETKAPASESAPEKPRDAKPGPTLRVIK
jgi:stringent starvation protein B